MLSKLARGADSVNSSLMNFIMGFGILLFLTGIILIIVWASKKSSNAPCVNITDFGGLSCPKGETCNVQLREPGMSGGQCVKKNTLLWIGVGLTVFGLFTTIIGNLQKRTVDTVTGVLA